MGFLDGFEVSVIFFGVDAEFFLDHGEVQFVAVGHGWVLAFVL